MSTVTISLRVKENLGARIDHSAQRNGQTRSEYILSWLPDYYDPNDEELFKSKDLEP